LAKASEIKKQAARIFNIVLYCTEEENCFPTINESMIIGESHIHHGSGYNIFANYHWPLLD
jgi:hypothetical protein